MIKTSPNRNLFFFFSFLLLPISFLPIKSLSQSKDSLNKKGLINTPPDSSQKRNPVHLPIPFQPFEITGRVSDINTKIPLAFVTVAFIGSTEGATTDENGVYKLKGEKGLTQIRFELTGYKDLVIKDVASKSNIINVKLVPNQKILKELVVKSKKGKKYTNKNNPAVSLIQEIINHKNENRIASQDFMQYDQYENITFSLINLSKKFIHGKFFKNYRFLLDSTKVIDDIKQTTLPIYMSEKSYGRYFRRDPKKDISVLKAHREVNFNTFIDTAGLDIYLNRLIGNVDIYENNIFILTNELLSPISDHAPNYYKYFITDTVQNGKEKFLEVTFTPRVSEDLLFEGKLYITMDGKFAVKGIDLSLGRHININFIRSFKVHQDFDKNKEGKYYITKTVTQSDFGIFKNQSVGLYGERIVTFSNYQNKVQLADSFYNGPNLRSEKQTQIVKNSYWDHLRGDTLTYSQSHIYSNMDSLQQLPSFKKTIWFTTLFIGGYGVLGPVQTGPLSSLYAFNNQEGTRVSVGGRTTPLFNKSLYLEDYIAYGFTDKKVKYYTNFVFSFNKTPPYRFPNDYLKISYQYDTDIPGQNFLIDKSQSLLRSFSRGTVNFWQYNTNFHLAYYKDVNKYISYNVDLKLSSSKPAGDLVYQPADLSLPSVTNLKTGELSMAFRYAPNQQIFQGTVRRVPIHNKYPIYNIKLTYGIKGLNQNPYNYLNAGASIYKRFYVSQLGYSDLTLQGGFILGKVPFPLLDIISANQTYVYDINAYNAMNFLEFVSDRYASLNFNHNFGGFFLNKIPLLQALHWREILSFKILYGGLSNTNNPQLHPELYGFPTGANNVPITFALGKTPYIEAGAGIGNILKFLRIDVVERFNYLDNPGVSRYGLRFSFQPDL